MIKNWETAEKMEIPHTELVERLRCGPGALTAWCHAQPSAPSTDYKLRDGICFLRSFSNWRNEDGVTEIYIPAFHAGTNRFQQVGIIYAVTAEANDTTQSISAEIISPYVGKVITALRKDIIENRLYHV